MKRSNNNNKGGDNKKRYCGSGKAKKTKKRKLRHKDKRAIKDMIDNVKPDEYDKYSDYIGWDND